jgi:hypothetical protein
MSRQITIEACGDCPFSSPGEWCQKENRSFLGQGTIPSFCPLPESPEVQISKATLKFVLGGKEANAIDYEGNPITLDIRGTAEPAASPAPVAVVSEEALWDILCVETKDEAIGQLKKLLMPCGVSVKP